MTTILNFSLLILAFHLIKTIKGTMNKEVFPILRGVKDIVPQADRIHAVLRNQKRDESFKDSDKSLPKIPFQDSSLSPLICYPENNEEYRDVYFLSHIMCRRMGYMTFSSITPRIASSVEQTRIKTKNVTCSDLQRGASSCNLLQNGTDDCEMVTEVTCGACNGTVRGFGGEIKSSGFPFASFEDVTCEWNIIVPEHHDIILSFNQFDALDVESADLPCPLHNPYVLIMYGIQNKVTTLRYCRLDEVKNLSIPFHSVKIIAFTGLQGMRYYKDELGISITFKATLPVEESYNSPYKMLAFFLLGIIVIVCAILCHYIQKHKLCDCIVKDKSARLLARRREQPYDMQDYRTRIQSENMKSNKCPKEDCEKAEGVQFQRNSNMIYETEKGIYEYSSLLDSSAGFIPSVTRTRNDDVTENLNVSLHKKLNLVHSYHGNEDPNRLSVSSPKEYHDYPSFISSSHASSLSCLKDEKKKVISSLSTC